MSGRLIEGRTPRSAGARGHGCVPCAGDGRSKVVFGDILDEEGKSGGARLAGAARYVHLDVASARAVDWLR